MDPHRHASDRNAFESLLRQVPGFRGYLEEEYRRESDQLVRSWLADQLQLAKQALDQESRRLADQVQLDALPPIERLRARLDAFMNRLRSAERGYSGLFDFVRTNETQLDQVYLVDMGLVEGMKGLLGACQSFATTPGSGADGRTSIQGRLTELERQFQERGEILRGLGK